MTLDIEYLAFCSYCLVMFFAIFVMFIFDIEMAGK